MAATTKQKVLLILVILAFAYAAWQAYQLFFKDRVSVTPTTPTVQVKQTKKMAPTTVTPDQASTDIPSIGTSELTPLKPQTNTSTTTPTTTTTTTTTAQPSAATTTTARKTTTGASYQQRTGGLTAAVDNAMAADTPIQLKKLTAKKTLTGAQQEYLHLVEQYQIAKLRRQVAEEEAAIAETQAKIAETRAKTRTLLGTGATTEMGSSYRSITPYQLMYVDYQRGQWTANLAHDGVYHEVKVGSILPDGTKVTAINKQRILLKKDGQRIYLSFTSARFINNHAQSSAVDQPAVAQATTTTRTTSAAYQPAETTAQASSVQTPAQTSSQVLTASNTVTTLDTPPPAASHTTQRDNAIADAVAEDDFLTIQPPSKTDLASTPAATATNNQPKAVLSMQKPTAATTAQVRPNTSKPALATKQPSGGTTVDQPYALQLMGAFAATDLENFARLENIQNKTQVVKTRYKGRPWYVLLYGQYQTTAAALNALKQLPKTLRQGGAWVRKIPA